MMITTMIIMHHDDDHHDVIIISIESISNKKICGSGKAATICVGRGGNYVSRGVPARPSLTPIFIMIIILIIMNINIIIIIVKS